MVVGDIERWLDPDWRMRCLAWWEGYDLDALKARRRRSASLDPERALIEEAVPSDQPPASIQPAVAPPVDAALQAVTAVLGAVSREHRQTSRRLAWTQERVVATECLWGHGWIGPESDLAVLDVAKGMGLGCQSDVLDAAAGLGGTARSIAASTGARVMGLEPDPLLALLANRSVETSGIGVNAPIYTYDPDRFAPPGAFELVVADGIVRRVKEPDLYLDGLVRSLRRGGSLLLSDYVVPGRMPDRAVRHWCKAEREPLNRLREEDIRRRLDAGGVQVRAVQDATFAHRRRILDALRSLMQRLEGMAEHALPLAAISEEVNLWNARLMALANGAAFLRLLAVRG